MLRHFLTALVVLAALWFGGRLLVRAVVSDETLVRWTVDDMLEGFNATRVAPILAALDASFVDETYGADRELVRAACVQLFFEETDSQTKEFRYRAEWAPPAVRLVEDADAAPRAEIDLEVSFLRRKGGGEELVWKVLVAGQMEKRDGAWRFVHSETRTLEGERPR